MKQNRLDLPWTLRWWCRWTERWRESKPLSAAPCTLAVGSCRKISCSSARYLAEPDSFHSYVSDQFILLFGKGKIFKKLPPITSNSVPRLAKLEHREHLDRSDWSSILPIIQDIFKLLITNMSLKTNGTLTQTPTKEVANGKVDTFDIPRLFWFFFLFCISFSLGTRGIADHYSFGQSESVDEWRV